MAFNVQFSDVKISRDKPRGILLMKKILTELKKLLPSRSKELLLSKIPVIGVKYRDWSTEQHPYDKEFGTDTGGFIDQTRIRPNPQLIQSNPALVEQIHPYIGTQPSTVRNTLIKIPNISNYTFVDIGCGKGRPLLVASEFPFKNIIGIEISSPLTKKALRNAEIIKKRFPNRTNISVLNENAASYNSPSDYLVIFFYHAFGRDLFKTFIANIERQLSNTIQHVFIIYVNPVNGDVIDESKNFIRFMAEKIPYDPLEIGYGAGMHENVIVWQSLPVRYPAHEGADREIITQESVWGVELSE